MQQNNCKTRAGRRARSRLARVLTMLALLLCVSTGAWAQTETYTVRMMDGTKDAGNWTMASGEKSATGSDPDGLTGLRENDPVNLTYSGRQKVKGVKAKVVNPLETPLTAAPELPALTLADRCYSYMFQDCTALTTVPAELPATTLSIYCYYCMFKNCTALESAPVLPATKLPTACYRQMFSGCSMLSAVTCLATNIRAINCTYEWLDGVASQGTFTKAAAADWSVKTGTSGIPSGWTVQNASDN